ncbi:MAG: FimB/Mfa2 family fimbrial subunit [Alistipes sp.]|nr:FimB/Mfa2 family fimbrial subunit [Alistipes sp.]
MELLSCMKRVVCGVWGLLVLCTLGVACDGLIYEDEGDCSVTYRVKFRYDWNMKFADAFASEVESVTLYLLDGSGNIVWQRTEQGEALASEEYAMTVDVAPGTYDLLAWAGTTDKGSFPIATDAATREELTCTLRRTQGASAEAEVRGDIDRLYHGYLAGQTFGEEEGVHTYTLSLKKDTNNVRVVLQQLSGEQMDPERFTFAITAENGAMDWDNELLPDQLLTYYAWHTQSGVAGIESDDPNYISSLSAVIAELTTARLTVRDRMAPLAAGAAEEAFPEANKMRLKVTDNQTGRTVVSVPLVDYALLVKGEYRKTMDDQEFLDRMDEYSLIFVLDDQLRWVSMSVNIHSWKLVMQNTSL